VAQIGAVLGRDFAYQLLRGVAELDESTLQSSLERLAEADLVFVEGAPPEARYRFKHALIQDAAYDSLLKSRRQALHRHAAEALRDANAEPEAIAHHFTQAGLDDLAIEWWGKAGDQALRRSAFQEAISQLGRAIALADKGAGETAPRHAVAGAITPNLRVKLQTDYGTALMWRKGFDAEETKIAFARVNEFEASAESAAARFVALDAQCLRNFTRGEYAEARDRAETFLREAEAEGRAMEAGAARRMLGLVLLHQGNLNAARLVLEQALADYLPERDATTQFRFGRDTEVSAAAYLALTYWQLGKLELARQSTDRALRRADELGSVAARAHALFWQTVLETVRGNAFGAHATADTLRRLTEASGIRTYADFSQIYASWAYGRLVDPSAGASRLTEAIATLNEAQGDRTGAKWFPGLLAELELATSRPHSALRRIDEALEIADLIGGLSRVPYLYRLRGDILLKCNPADPVAAENAYQTAIAIARQQGARSYELLASLALAKLYQSTARHADAHAILTPALEGFAPADEMPEIGEGQALLAALAETEQVKADAARRHQLTQLHVSYGNALIAARGFAAPETTKAFTRARESAASVEDAPGRLAADYGSWVGSYVRFELPSMKTHATAFLRDVASRPDSPEAGVAHRAAGVTSWFAGEYVEARDHFERALSLFQPGRDDDLAFRFGQDAGVAAMVFLAIVSWPLGNLRRAISLVEDAHERIASVAHVQTQAYAKYHAAWFELMRGDRARAAQNASEVARLASEHDLPDWQAVGAFLEGLATTERGALGEGLSDMRRSAERLREQNRLFFDGLLKIALAGAEARAGDTDRALAVLDEGLATADRTGFRAFDAELHRARGEILLKRDPANPAAAEKAFLTALAVTKQQGTRSFELRATTSLAKLYQSTDRPLEAHDVLAPALEGFAPTPEMPEIAEAQALLVAIEAAAHLTHE
jgi:tetratricopeptide (TPR) repeat protein